MMKISGSSYRGRSHSLRGSEAARSKSRGLHQPTIFIRHFGVQGSATHRYIARPNKSALIPSLYLGVTVGMCRKLVFSFSHLLTLMFLPNLPIPLFPMSLLKCLISYTTLVLMVTMYLELILVCFAIMENHIIN